MNCPACGSHTTDDQKFCRLCGATLETAGNSGTNSRLRLFRIGLATMFLSLTVALTGAMLLHIDIVIYGGLVGMILGIFLIGYAAVGPSRSAKRTARPTQPDALPKAETTRKLAPMNEMDFVPSVTERTTSLLETHVANPNKPKSKRR